MPTIQTNADFRKNLLTQIVLARREYYRLQGEIATMTPTLPQGCYIGRYRSNYKWEYYTLGHKDAVFPSARDPMKMTIKRHLGLAVNPSYRQALTSLEATRVYQIKLETLHGVTSHLVSLKFLWRSHRENFQKCTLDQKFNLNREDSRATADFISSFEA